MNRPRGGGLSLPQIYSPAQLILVLENVGLSPVGDVYQLAFVRGNMVDFQGHLGTINFVFADGHAKALKPSATGAPLNLWNTTNTSMPGDASGGPASPAWQSALDGEQKMN